jgi:hypothetical protein
MAQGSEGDTGTNRARHVIRNDAGNRPAIGLNRRQRAPAHRGEPGERQIFGNGAEWLKSAIVHDEMRCGVWANGNGIQSYNVIEA